jgi:cytosine deaminase
MHSMDNYYVSKLLPLMKESGVAVIANPLINAWLQGRHDTYPKRRGLTRVPELMAQGIPVAFGHDCVMDPWYPLGSADMLEVASMAIHMAQLTSLDAMRACFDAVTTIPARIMGIDDYGIEPGRTANLVMLDAGDPIEAIRLKAPRLVVVRRGEVVAETPPRLARLHAPGRPATVSLLRGGIQPSGAQEAPAPARR